MTQAAIFLRPHDVYNNVLLFLYCGVNRRRDVHGAAVASLPVSAAVSVRISQSCFV